MRAFDGYEQIRRLELIRAIFQYNQLRISDVDILYAIKITKSRLYSYTTFNFYMPHKT